MLRLTRCLSRILRKFDLFPATQYLRYKEEPEYKTATGGCVSIAVITICFILFYSFALQTINKKIIYGQVTYEIQVEPQELELTITKSPQFLFLVAMPGFNLSDTSKKYFNITLDQNLYGPNFGDPRPTRIPLVKCTPQHFSYNSQVSEIYNKFQLSIGLCPPFNHPFDFKGKVISPEYKSLSIHVEYCNKTIDPACVTDAEFTAKQQSMGGSFTIGLILINTIVNPGEEEYMKTYVEDQNYFYFNPKTGYEVTAQIQEMEVNTDLSILPTTDIRTQKIIAIPNVPRVRTRQPYNNRYIDFVLNKAKTSTVFNRKFNKIDDYFSYVGGLVGTILLFFFILGSYSEKSYVVNIASDIYSNDEDANSEQKKKFNFFYYFCILIKSLCQMVHLKFTWKEPDRFTDIMDEMEKQLNITYIIKRLNLFQSALTSILSEHQFKALLLSEKKSIKEAAQIRKKNSRLLRMQKVIQSKNEENKLNDSSLNNIADSNIQENIQIKQPSEMQDSNFQSSSSKTFKQGSNSSVKENVIQVINQSRQGNPISKRILKRLNRKIFPEINQPLNEIGAKEKNGSSNQLKEEREEGEKDLKGLQHFHFQLN